MKLDKTSDYRPGVALATVAAALTIAAGVTIAALASYATTPDRAEEDTNAPTATSAPGEGREQASSGSVERATAARSPSTTEDEQLATLRTRSGRDHERRGNHHERSEHEDDDDDDD